MLKKIISFMLALMLIVMTGCGGKSGNMTGNIMQNSTVDEVGAADESGSQKAMGRYVESQQDLSDMVTRAAGMVKMADGSIVIQDYYNGQIISRDNGISWESVPQPWLSELHSKAYIHAMEPAGDGSVAIVYSMQEENMHDQEAPEDEIADKNADEDTDESAEEMMEFNWQYALVSPDGTLQPIEGALDNDELLSPWFNEQGEVFMTGYSNIVYRVDKESRKIEKYLETEERTEQLFFSEQIMVAVTTGGLYLYDMEQEEWISDEVLTDFIDSNIKLEYTYNTTYDSRSLLPVLAGDGSMYLAFSGGLYRHVISGSAMEQIIDGGLSSFSDPSMEMINILLLADNEFLTLFTGGKLVHHTYDPDMPTVPDQQIRVYSLEHNDLLQMAIINYQAQNPAVYVKYEVGREGTSPDGNTSVTREDALKNLNTEIMAGQGPDLILLDEMPLRSYMEKGILADISPWLTGTEETETLIEAVRNTYQKDDSIYAIPATFRVAVLAGDKASLNKMTDLEAMADTIEEIRSSYPDGNILGLYTPQQVIKALSLSSAPLWQNEDGSINEAVLTEFLSQAKRIYQAELAGISEERMAWYNETTFSMISELGNLYDENEYFLMSGSAGINIASGDSRMSIAYVEDGFSLATLISGMERVKDREMDLKEIAGQAEHVYIPTTIVGMLASSKNQEQAGELLKVLLSEETMNYTHVEYPINQAALDRLFTNTYSDSREIGAMSVSNSAGEGMVLDINWPEDKWLNQFHSLVQSVDTPDLTDYVVKDMVLAEGAAALTEEVSVEQAVAVIMKKLSIYLAE